MAVLLAVLTGGALGYVIERGDLCFQSTLRGLFSIPRQMDLFRAYLLALLVAIPLVNGMFALGWIAPWVPPFAWQANIIGGLIFGVGMVVAATCVTGLFYKLGHGMLGTLIGLIAWAAGDILTYRGLLSPLRNNLNAAVVTVEGSSATLANVFGSWGWTVVLGAGAAIAVYLWRSPHEDRGNLWDWRPLGLGVGLVTSLAWPLAQLGGSNYTFGTSSIPTGIYSALVDGPAGGSLWVPLTLISLVPGAFLAARLSGTFWLRGETVRRYLELAVGGFLMGLGAAISGGCNLGHSLVGVPLLSLGSISTTLAMAAGVFLASRLIKPG